MSKMVFMLISQPYESKSLTYLLKTKKKLKMNRIQ